MSLGSYLVGVAWLAAIVGALAFGSVRTRRRMLPDFVGAPARLAEITLGLGAFVLVPELLGAVGWFRRLPVLVALVATGVGAGLLAGPSRASAPADPPAPADPLIPATGGARPRLARGVTVGALALAAVVLGQWAGHVVASYASYPAGIWDGDSLWYHLPFATSYVQTGWTTRPLFTNADTLVTYFPANSEVVLGMLLMPFRRDIAVPIVNLAWVGLTFLAAWCLGRRFGAPAVALAGAAVALSLPVMVATQSGTARNDAMGVALFVTAAALVAHADWHRNGMLVAGIAAGLAVGVKLSVLAPVAILAVAVVIAAPRGRRWQVAWPWGLSITVFGAFWYVRNLVLVGNPVPTIGVHLGPLSLPSVLATSVADTAVADRLREAGAVGRVLRPGLGDGFGTLWWLIVLVTVATPIVLLVRGPDRIRRMLAAVVLVGGLAYVVMPNGSPFGDTPLASANFMLNLRYVVPVTVLAFVLVAALPRMRDARWAATAVVAFAVLIVVDVTDAGLRDYWEWVTSGRQRLVGYVGAGVAVLVVVAAVLLLRRAPRARVVALLAAGALVAVVFGYAAQREYLDRRYAEVRPGAPALSALWPWANDLPASRVGVVGTIFQYPFTGERLASTVRYVGVPRDDGGFRPARSCRELRERLREGRYRYLVTTVDDFGSNVREIRLVNRWTRSIEGARVLETHGPATLFELTEDADPDACP